MPTLETANVIIIIIAAILIIVTAFIKRDKNLVTVIGILGTFIGIILGLLSFDTANIEGSISALLNGLKTAFLTSIFGLIAALVLGFLEKKEEQKDDRDYLIDIRNELKKLNEKDTSEATGDNNEAVLAELQKINTNQMALGKSFENFAEKMSENNSKALVEAMTQVMKDFNSSINSELSKSFNDLSTGVTNLLKWQEAYQNDIEISAKLLKVAQTTFSDSSDLLSTVAKNSQSFAGVSESLSKELVTLNSSLVLLQNGTNEFSGVSEKFTGMSQDMLILIEGLTKNFMQKGESLLRESEQQMGLVSSTFANQSSELTQAHTVVLSHMKKQIDANNDKMSEQFLRMGNRLEQQVQILDEQLGRELTKSLNTLGSQLTSISEKFVSDYSVLAEKLENLVKNSKK